MNWKTNQQRNNERKTTQNCDTNNAVKWVPPYSQAQGYEIKLAKLWHQLCVCARFLCWFCFSSREKCLTWFLHCLYKMKHNSSLFSFFSMRTFFFWKHWTDISPLLFSHIIVFTFRYSHNECIDKMVSMTCNHFPFTFFTVSKGKFNHLCIEHYSISIYNSFFYSTEKKGEKNV